MATVNLGNIKLNWKGAYNAGTAYVIDDVVSYNGSSYVCISATTGNLPTVTAKWNQMSAAGTNGTDVGTTITTQGDILYRDGSGLQRLAKPASNKFLQNTSGGVLSWETVSSKIVNVAFYQNNTEYSNTSSSSYVTATNHAITYTPSSASNKLLIQWMPHVRQNSGGSDVGFRYKITKTIGGTATTLFEDGTNIDTYWYDSSGGQRLQFPRHYMFDDNPNTTSAITFSIDFRNPHSGQQVRISDGQAYSKWVIWEYTT